MPPKAFRASTRFADVSMSSSMAHRSVVHHPARPRRRTGLSLVWALVCMAALLGFVSLAVDVGRIQAAKTELRRAADAAARYAVTGIRDNTYRAKAVAAAAENKVDGTALALDNGDITVGTWDSGTFSSGGNAPNAVRVRAYRTAERGNPIPLTFARVLGLSSSDVKASAIAAIPDTFYGVVGLNSVSMNGNATSSYWSTTGAASGPYGSIASNGPITLSGNTMINGDARPGIGYNVSGASGRVTGSTASVAKPLSYPNGNAGNYVNVNDNALVPAISGSSRQLNIGGNQIVAMPAGTYYLSSLTVNAGGTLNITGPVTIYITGSLQLTGNAVVAGNLPKNLKIVMVGDAFGNPPGTAQISSGAALYATIYAPQSDITMSGSGDIYGSVLGKTISMTGSSAIHYDLSLTGTTGVIQMVK
jgi:Flp pilus assembly protein TadG